MTATTEYNLPAELKELQQLLDLLLNPQGMNRTEHGLRGMALAYPLGDKKRAELLPKVQAHLRTPNLPDRVRQALLSLMGYLEQDYSLVVNKIKPYMTYTRVKANYGLKPGCSASPTAFIRSGVFSRQDRGELALKVLGARNVQIKRRGGVLNETHLQVMLYLVSLVDDYDAKLGTLVQVQPREAVRKLGWCRNNLSVQRLRKALQELSHTHIELVQEVSTGRSTDLTMLANTTTDELEDGCWSVQLLAPMLNMLQDPANRTYLSLEVLAALPNGAATWLYAFIKSHAMEKTVWDADELAFAAGITKGDPYKRRHALKEALQVLAEGVVVVKARGKAAAGATGASSGVAKTFPRPLACFRFYKDAGRHLVELVRA